MYQKLVFVVFLISFSGCHQSQQTAMELKVMTYNIHHGNPPDQTGIIELEPIIQLLKKEKPDLVALQEVDQKTRRSNLTDQAKKIAVGAGYQYHHFYQAIEFQGGGYGLAILSKFKTGLVKMHRLPGTEDSEPRILAIMEISLGEDTLIFANTHLDHQKESNRILQVNRIMEITTEYSNPMILVGDFNAVEGSDPISLLEEKYTKTCAKCEATFPNPEHGHAIDFIMTHPEEQIETLQHRVLNEINYSDHFPVMAVLKIKFPS